MRILVTGGAGYIGSHMVRKLCRAGYEVVVIDNLSTGHREAVGEARFIRGDIAGPGVAESVVRSERPDAVVHFAGLSEVSESVRDPAGYYRHNVVGTQYLLDSMIAGGVRKIVFSSSASVYGDPAYLPIDESHPKRPVSPYGMTKWVAEQMLEDYGRAYGLRSVSLRYFNVAGADPEGEVGERHDPEFHLIPRLLKAAAGTLPEIRIFGDDYDTVDGTCIRDFVHVDDLCSAHLGVLQALSCPQSHVCGAYNVGTGVGHSIKAVVNAVERVTQRTIPVVYAPRRAGDPSELVADPSRLIREVHWQPRFEGLETMVEHAWRWERRMTSCKR